MRRPHPPNPTFSSQQGNVRPGKGWDPVQPLRLWCPTLIEGLPCLIESPHQAHIRLALRPLSNSCNQSFQTRHPLQNHGCLSLGPRGPLPATLGVLLELIQRQASVLICRDHPYPPATTFSPHPIPGDYFPEKSTKHVFDSAPGHSISARTKTFQLDSTPGPQPRWPMADWVGGPDRVGGAPP